VSSNRQQTMAKLARERAVKEKRERKLEKKRERKLAGEAAERGEHVTDESRLEDTEPDLRPNLNDPRAFEAQG
jgi:hypothetical protein